MLRFAEQLTYPFEAFPHKPSAHECLDLHQAKQSSGQVISLICNSLQGLPLTFRDIDRAEASRVNRPNHLEVPTVWVEGFLAVIRTAYFVGRAR